MKLQFFAAYPCFPIIPYFETQLFLFVPAVPPVSRMSFPTLLSLPDKDLLLLQIYSVVTFSVKVSPIPPGLITNDILCAPLITSMTGTYLTGTYFYCVVVSHVSVFTRLNSLSERNVLYFFVYWVPIIVWPCWKYSINVWWMNGFYIWLLDYLS